MASKRTTSSGTCQLCGEQFKKNVIVRHLAKCIARHDAETASQGKAKRREILHLSVEGRYLPEYWLHLETPANSHFAALDAYLRYIWLECCGHASAFRLPEPKPVVAAGRNNLFRSLLAAVHDEIDDMMREEEAVMGSKLGGRVKVGDTFHHDYDFGSTTELKLKVVGKRDGTMKPGDVRLLARNLPPDVRCRCGRPAVSVCGQCMWDGDGWLCKACGKKHECGDDILLPVVNSPRVGVCGYCGPDDDDEFDVGDDS